MEGKVCYFILLSVWFWLGFVLVIGFLSGWLIGWGFWCMVPTTCKVKLLSRVRLFETPWTIDYQASPSMGFSRQEYWSGLPFPSPKVLNKYLLSGAKRGRNLVRDPVLSVMHCIPRTYHNAM